MSSLNETLQQIVNEDYDTLVGMAKRAIIDILPICKKIDATNDGVMMLTSVLMAAVSADNKLSALESKFIGEITGLSSEAILSLARIKPAETAALVDRFADALTPEDKAAVCLLVSTIFACDETINAQENQYLHRIMA